MFRRQSQMWTSAAQLPAQRRRRDARTEPTASPWPWTLFGTGFEVGVRLAWRLLPLVKAKLTGRKSCAFTAFSRRLLVVIKCINGQTHSPPRRTQPPVKRPHLRDVHVYLWSVTDVMGHSRSRHSCALHTPLTPSDSDQLMLHAQVPRFRGSDLAPAQGSRVQTMHQ